MSCSFRHSLCRESVVWRGRCSFSVLNLLRESRAGRLRNEWMNYKPVSLPSYDIIICNIKVKLKYWQHPLPCITPVFDIEIVGGANTPYEGGVFTLEINIPERWDYCTHLWSWWSRQYVQHLMEALYYILVQYYFVLYYFIF